MELRIATRYLRDICYKISPSVIFCCRSRIDNIVIICKLRCCEVVARPTRLGNNILHHIAQAARERKAGKIRILVELPSPVCAFQRNQRGVIAGVVNPKFAKRKHFRGIVVILEADFQCVNVRIVKVVIRKLVVNVIENQRQFRGDKGPDSEAAVGRSGVFELDTIRPNVRLRQVRVCPISKRNAKIDEVVNLAIVNGLYELVACLYHGNYLSMMLNETLVYQCCGLPPWSRSHHCRTGADRSPT